MNYVNEKRRQENRPLVSCERLYTHRNTVLYRIRKIKEDFGLDLDAPEKHLKYLLSAAVILAKNGETEMFVTD